MKISALIPCACALALLVPASSLDGEVKRTLAGNMVVNTKVLPGDTDTLSGIFEEGIVYGRVRSNFFRFEWDEELEGSRKNNASMGLGGSVIFKSAYFNGLGFTVGIYGTSNPFYRMDHEDIRFLRSGKDVLSRYEVSTEGSYEFAVIGEAYLDWKLEKNRLLGGRQLFESVFTASNDTKMIPNTFDGVVYETKIIPDTTLRFAWFARQKLRDHTSAHDVITFRDAEGASWGNQDDSAVHRGLNYAALVAAGESPENDLFLFTSKNSSIPDTTLQLSSVLVPDLFLSTVLEAAYKIGNGDWSYTPSVRLFVQSDEGGGPIGGASLSGNVSNANPGGYRDPDSLDAWMGAARIDASHKPTGTRIRFGFSSVGDEADLIAPWRGFPTGGYTRAMGQYNWRANTDTWMLQLNADFGKLDWLKGFKASARYAIMDFDETKGFNDINILHIDLIQDFAMIEGLMGKFRLAFVDNAGSGSYNEYRLEFNYLF